MRYEDLPAAMRAQVDASEGRVPVKRRGKGGGSVGGGGPWRCAACGALFTVWAKAERHATVHGRVELVLEGPFAGLRSVCDECGAEVASADPWPGHPDVARLSPCGHVGTVTPVVR